MAFLNNPSENLSRYSIGEIQDLSGVPNFYNAGSSTWLRSATATASSNLSATSKTNLANAGTSTIPTVLAQSALSSSYMASGFYASYPIQRISASSISVVPAIYSGTTSVGVGVMTAAGIQTIATGQTSLRTANQGGSNGFVASNDTTIFSYCFSSATALSAYYTTTGTTWTAGTVTGIPVFATSSDTVAHASQISAGNNLVAGMCGWKRSQSGAGKNQFAVFWCGARFVLLAPAATNYMVSLSTNGLAWGGDNTTAVIGATAQAKALSIQFYRNGNNCYLNVGSAYRYSTDGGVTWAASTFAGAPDPIGYYLQYNQTDPAKLVIYTPAALAVYYSADSGATWSASRPLPAGFEYTYSLIYRGSTLCISNASANGYRVSTDDGVTWNSIIFPVGTLASTFYFYADAYRWYAGAMSQPQILTSSDAVTWTLITVSQNYVLNQEGVSYGTGLVTFDTNTAVMMGNNANTTYNQFISTTDGGVTWTMGQYTVGNYGGDWGVGNAFVTPDAGGVGFALGMTDFQSGENALVMKADIVAGGAFYRTGATAITPIRTGALSYVRVG